MFRLRLAVNFLLDFLKEADSNLTMNSLSNLEKWAIEKKINPKRVVTPLDRLSFRLNLLKKPLIYFDFLPLAVVLTAYWIISFVPLFIFAAWVILKVLFNYSILPLLAMLFIDGPEHGAHLLIFILLSILQGALSAFFRVRAARKLNLPPWKEDVSLG